MTGEFEHLDRIRRRLLDAALGDAAFDGWTARTLARAEAAADLEPGSADLACPGGVADLLDFWGLEADRAVETALADADLAGLKIRELVALGVRARVEAIGADRKEAARRALARLALPDLAPRGARILWRAADTIWRGIGDTSTDGAFYTKRAILSGVLANVVAAWLADDADAAWAVLDRRIGAVMQFEKTKARVRDWTAKLPDPAEILAGLRYPSKR